MRERGERERGSKGGALIFFWCRGSPLLREGGEEQRKLFSLCRFQDVSPPFFFFFFDAFASQQQQSADSCMSAGHRRPPRREADAQLSAPDTAAVAHGNRSSNRSGRAEDGGWWRKRPVAPARRREQVHAVENRWLGERGDVESSKLED